MVNTDPLKLDENGVMGGSLGLNMDTYFDPGLRDTDARIDRLERAISAMHRDLKTLAVELQKPQIIPASYTPATTQAVSNAAPTNLYQPSQVTPAEPSIYQNNNYRAALPPMPGGAMPAKPPTPLYGQANAAAQNTTTSPYDRVIASRTAVSATPANNAQANNIPPPAPATIGSTASVDKGPRPVTNGGSAIVSGIRVGQHPDKVRVVFDVTKKTDYTVDLDNSENLMVVELPNAKWKTPTKTESFGKMPVVKSYKVDSFNDGAGNMFILQLKKPTQIIMQGKYPALSGKGERIVIDLKK